MTSRFPFLGALALGSMLAVACGSSGESTGSNEDAIRELRGSAGTPCTVNDDCRHGLICDFSDRSGPPPSAVGLPVLPETGNDDGPPPGAVGLPVLPEADAGASGPPPGAVGLPLRVGVCRQDGPPPGAVGLPIR